ncbi:Nuclear receptor subfamily 1 group D member 1, partial [Clarias magur]
AWTIISLGTKMKRLGVRAVSNQHTSFNWLSIEYSAGTKPWSNGHGQSPVHVYSAGASPA